MAILAYQAFIVFSLIVIRVVARRHLATACFVWSAFTVFNLFFWPLILVQLAVVWLTYAVLNPQDDRPRVPDEQLAPLADSSLTPAASRTAGQTHPHTHSHPNTNTPTRTPPPVATHKTAGHDASPSLLGAFNKTITNLNTFIERASAIQEATSRLDGDIGKEKIVIELSLATARQAIERDARFVKDPDYKKNYEHFYALLSSGPDKSSPKDDKTDSLLEVPNFRLPARHVDESIADAIELRIGEMQQQREVFFTNLKQTLDPDPGLRTHFFKSMESFKHSKAWEAELQARLQPPAPTAKVSRFMLGSILTTVSTTQAQLKPPATLTEAQFKQKQPPILFDEALILELKEDLARHKPPASTAKAPPLITTQPRMSEQAQIVNLAKQADPASTLRRTHIQAEAAERGIRHLVHFTRVANLPSIMSNGLLSVQAAHLRGLAPLSNDRLRLDGRNDAVSLSISFPNAAMFYKYRQLHPQDRWVVLLLSPEILWTQDCAYCLHNAADRRIRSRPWSALTTDEAFQSMFAEAPDGAPTRASQRLGLSDPTDAQAEVLVRGNIDPSMLAQMIFEHPDDLEAHLHHTVGRRARVQVRGSDFFASRQFVRQKGSVA